MGREIRDVFISGWDIRYVGGSYGIYVARVSLSGWCYSTTTFSIGDYIVVIENCDVIFVIVHGLEENRMMDLDLGEEVCGFFLMSVTSN